MTTKVVSLALTLLLGSVALAQDASQDKAAAVKQALAANQKNLRTYTWVETTQITLKGEVKKQEQKQCFYGADGKVQKNPVPGAAAPQAKPQAGGGGRGGRLKEKIVENKVDDMKDYLEKVAALVQEYVPPDPQKIQAAQTAGNVTAQPSGGTLNLSVKNYAKPGDMLAIGFNTATKLLASYTVTSFVEKPKEDEVKLAVTFGSLQDGTSYPQQVLLDVVSKKIQVKVTNSGYKKAG
jgi:hypothetical protein